MVEYQCWRCPPKLEVPDLECHVCKGTKRWQIHRCPNKAIEDPVLHSEVCNASVFIEQGLVPAAVGWQHLPACLMQAISFVSGERAIYREALREREKERRRNASKRSPAPRR